jgi:hypothetical protein
MMCCNSKGSKSSLSQNYTVLNKQGNGEAIHFSIPKKYYWREREDATIKNSTKIKRKVGLSNPKSGVSKINKQRKINTRKVGYQRERERERVFTALEAKKNVGLFE